MKIVRLLTLVSIACMAMACSNKDTQFIVEGKIADADSSVLYLEKRELNKISILDSVKLDDKGEFKFKETATLYPEFYVLRMNGEVINFAADSAQTINIESTKKTFATDYTIDGLYNQQIKDAALAQYKATKELVDLQQKFNNKEVNEEEYINHVATIADRYKDTATKIIASNFKSPAAYFALFQKVGTYLFFDPYSKADYKLFAAVATSWDNYYSGSPRTPHLKEYTLIAMKVRKQNEQTLNAETLTSTAQVQSDDYYDLNLPDVNGKPVLLSSLKGKIVLLEFTTYQSENSPAHNVALNKLYMKYKPNMEIYQISLDADAHAWKNAAINLPWIAVHESKSVHSGLISKFNIQAFPTLFLMDKNGEFVKRLLPTDNLEAEIQKII